MVKDSKPKEEEKDHDNWLDWGNDNSWEEKPIQPVKATKPKSRVQQAATDSTWGNETIEWGEEPKTSTNEEEDWESWLAE